MIARFSEHSNRFSLPSFVLLLVIGVVALTDGQTPTGYDLLNERVPARLQDGLMAYYPFDKDGGLRTPDISGMDFHGKVSGATFITQGRVGGAYTFDGENDFIAVPEVRLNSFTFAAWVKVDATDDLGEQGELSAFSDQPGSGVGLARRRPAEPQWREGEGAEAGAHLIEVFQGSGINNRRIFTLADDRSCYALQGNVRGSIGVFVADDTEVNEYDWVLDPGQWAHVAVAHDGRTFRIFRDGELTETGEIATDGVAGTLYIGGTDIRRGGYWRGEIDEVMIWDRVLSEDQVAELGRPPFDK